MEPFAPRAIFLSYAREALVVSTTLMFFLRVVK